MPRNSPWTVEQCMDALERARGNRDAQAIARWTERLKDAKTAQLRAEVRAAKKRRVA